MNGELKMSALYIKNTKLRFEQGKRQKESDDILIYKRVRKTNMKPECKIIT